MGFLKKLSHLPRNVIRTAIRIPSSAVKGVSKVPRETERLVKNFGPTLLPLAAVGILGPHVAPIMSSLGQMIGGGGLLGGKGGEEDYGGMYPEFLNQSSVFPGEPYLDPFDEEKQEGEQENDMSRMGDLLSNQFLGSPFSGNSDQFGGSQLPTFLRSENRRRKNRRRIERYAKGGATTPIRKINNNRNTVGYIKASNSGGQADDLDVYLPDKSFVVNATVVSLLGDGYSDNGAKKLMEFEKDCEKRFLKSGVSSSSYNSVPSIRAKVSNGEYVVKPSVVDYLGKGVNSKGAKILYKLQENVMDQKGVKGVLPPKTKKMNYYIGKNS